MGPRVRLNPSPIRRAMNTNKMNKKKYLVYGWLNGSDYDANKSANVKTVVTTTSPDKAEDIADRRFKRMLCNPADVIEIQWSAEYNGRGYPSGRVTPANPGVIRTCQALRTNTLVD